MLYFVDSSSITTANLVLIVVGSVGAFALVTGISVCVAYTYSLQKKMSLLFKVQLLLDFKYQK